MLSECKPLNIAKLICVVVLALGLAGCSWSHFNIKNFFTKKKPEPSAEELMQEGLDKFYGHKYDDALNAFQKVKERYPFSKYATMAELRVADAHYYEEEYPEAVAAYEDFSRLHPQHPEIPRVLYQIGMCHYKQRLGIDRDQTETRAALEAFERVTKTYSKSEYAKKAQVLIMRCRELLAKHELYVAKFYYRTHQYKAAMFRLETLRNNYSDVRNPKLRKEFRELYTKCYKKLTELSAKGLEQNPKRERMFSDIWERVYFWRHKEKEEGKEKEKETVIAEPLLIEDQLEAQQKVPPQQTFEQTRQQGEKSFWSRLLFWKNDDEEAFEELPPVQTGGDIATVHGAQEKKKSFWDKIFFWRGNDETEIQQVQPVQTQQRVTASQKQGNTPAVQEPEKKKKSFWDKLRFWKHDDEEQ